jgi:simple sugar transport system ATP-binding protein
VSEDIDEVLELSDRVAVMFDGRVVGILGRDEASPEHIGAMMSRGAPLHAAT